MHHAAGGWWHISGGYGTSVGVVHHCGVTCQGGVTLVQTWLMAGGGRGKPKVSFLAKPLEVQLRAFFNGSEGKIVHRKRTSLVHDSSAFVIISGSAIADCHLGVSKELSSVFGLAR